MLVSKQGPERCKCIPTKAEAGSAPGGVSPTNKKKQFAPVETDQN